MNEITQLSDELEELLLMGPDEADILEEIQAAIAYGELTERYWFDQD